MINLIKQELSTLHLNNITDRSELSRLLYMDTLEVQGISNNMLESDTKLKVSVPEDKAQTTKFRNNKKKKKAANNDNSSSWSPHSRPYTWFLAIPSK